MERGRVDGVDRAAAGSEGEDRRGYGGQAVAIGGRQRGTARGEGAPEQQPPLRTHQEGVRVPGGHGQRGEAQRAPSLQTPGSR